MAPSWRSFPRSIVNSALRKAGYQLSRWPPPDQLSLDSAFSRLRARPLPFKVETVIDVGASDGRWSRKIMQYYPNARYLLIEANQVHEAALDPFRHQANPLDYLLAAAG